MNAFGDFLSLRVSRLEDPSFGDRLRRKKAAAKRAQRYSHAHSWLLIPRVRLRLFGCSIREKHKTFHQKFCNLA